VCDTSDLKNIEIDPDNMLARVGAGVLKDQLNKFLEPHGFFFGPDPSSNPSLGKIMFSSLRREVEWPRLQDLAYQPSNTVQPEKT
jgi:FAD/FMN-containing dehydrogenase